MAQLFVGTSGWAYPSWKPDFYPAKLAQTKFLSYYAGHLNTVEVNLTFRQLLKETTAQKWIAETPEHFRFGIKAHQVITHIKRLKNTADFIPRFFSTVEPLARSGKLGPILFQLPPNHSTVPKNAPPCCAACTSTSRQGAMPLLTSSTKRLPRGLFTRSMF